MFRRTAFLAALLVALTATTASAATTTITITSLHYPPSTTIGIGDTVTWQNQMQPSTHHTATGNTPLSLWSIDLNGNGTSGSKVFSAAGTFAFHCEIHPIEMHGNISVRMTAAPTSGTTATTFSIRWATVKAPAGFRYVVQRKAPGGAFAAFKSTVGKSASWTPSKPGTWSFRSRLKRLSNGSASGYSPVLTVSVTH